MWSRNKKIHELVRELSATSEIHLDDLNFIQQCYTTREDNILHLRIYLMQINETSSTTSSTASSSMLASLPSHTNSSSSLTLWQTQQELRTIINAVQCLERYRTEHENAIISKYSPPPTRTAAALPSISQKPSAAMTALKQFGFKIFSKIHKLNLAYLSKIQMFFPRLYEIICSEQVALNTSMRESATALLSSQGLNISKIFAHIAKLGRQRLTREVSKLNSYLTAYPGLNLERNKTNKNDRFYTDKNLQGLDSFSYVISLQKRFYLRPTATHKTLLQSKKSFLNNNNNTTTNKTVIVPSMYSNSLYEDILNIERKKGAATVSSGSTNSTSNNSNNNNNMNNDSFAIGNLLNQNSSSAPTGAFSFCGKEHESILEVILSNYEKHTKDWMAVNKHISYRIKLYSQHSAKVAAVHNKKHPLYSQTHSSIFSSSLAPTSITRIPPTIRSTLVLPLSTSTSRSVIPSLLAIESHEPHHQHGKKEDLKHQKYQQEMQSNLSPSNSLDIQQQQQAVVLSNTTSTAHIPSALSIPTPKSKLAMAGLSSLNQHYKSSIALTNSSFDKPIQSQQLQQAPSKGSSHPSSTGLQQTPSLAGLLNEDINDSTTNNDMNNQSMSVQEMSGSNKSINPYLNFRSPHLPPDEIVTLPKRLSLQDPPQLETAKLMKTLTLPPLPQQSSTSSITAEQQPQASTQPSSEQLNTESINVKPTHIQREPLRFSNHNKHRRTHKEITSSSVFASHTSLDREASTNDNAAKTQLTQIVQQQQHQISPTSQQMSSKITLIPIKDVEPKALSISLPQKQGNSHTNNTSTSQQQLNTKKSTNIEELYQLSRMISPLKHAAPIASTASFQSSSQQLPVTSPKYTQLPSASVNRKHIDSNSLMRSNAASIGFFPSNSANSSSTNLIYGNVSINQYSNISKNLNASSHLHQLRQIQPQINPTQTSMPPKRNQNQQSIALVGTNFFSSAQPPAHPRLSRSNQLLMQSQQFSNMVQSNIVAPLYIQPHKQSKPHFSSQQQTSINEFTTISLQQQQQLHNGSTTKQNTQLASGNLRESLNEQMQLLNQHSKNAIDQLNMIQSQIHIVNSAENHKRTDWRQTNASKPYISSKKTTIIELRKDLNESISRHARESNSAVESYRDISTPDTNSNAIRHKANMTAENSEDGAAYRRQFMISPMKKIAALPLVKQEQ